MSPNARLTLLLSFIVILSIATILGEYLLFRSLEGKKPVAVTPEPISVEVSPTPVETPTFATPEPTATASSTVKRVTPRPTASPAEQ